MRARLCASQPRAGAAQGSASRRDGEGEAVPRLRAAVERAAATAVPELRVAVAEASLGGGGVMMRQPDLFDVGHRCPECGQPCECVPGQRNEIMCNHNVRNPRECRDEPKRRLGDVNKRHEQSILPRRTS